LVLIFCFADQLKLCFGSIFTVQRPLSTDGTHQYELHQHDLVTGPWKLPLTIHPQRVMRRDVVDVACAV